MFATAGKEETCFHSQKRMNAPKHGGRVLTQVMDKQIQFIMRKDIIDFMYTHTLETHTHTHTHTELSA